MLFIYSSKIWYGKQITSSQTYLRVPLRQWGGSNVYLLVFSSWKVNIAKKPHCRNGVVDTSDCPYVLSQKKGLDSFSEIIFDCPIVRVSVLKKRELDSFSEIIFDRPIVPVSILEKRGLDSFWLLLTVRLSVCPFSKDD